MAMITKLFEEPADAPLQETMESCRREFDDRTKPAPVKHELWLLLSLFFIAFLLNSLLDAQRMLLGFYTLPTLFSAYKYGRRHAVLTAFFSVFLVVLVTYFNPVLFSHRMLPRSEEKWFDLTVWGGILVMTAYAMGTLYESKESHMHELKESYHGILTILQHIASDDKYNQSHAYRVAVCATKIGERMDLPSDRVEDIRSAALLHDIDRLGINREILYKSVNLTAEEMEEYQQRAVKDRGAVPPIGGSLKRVIAIVLAYQSVLDKNGQPADTAKLPLEGRIIAVADMYETLTSSPTSHLAPRDAIESIQTRAGDLFDEHVVDAFVEAYQHGRMASAPAATIH